MERGLGFNQYLRSASPESCIFENSIVSDHGEAFNAGLGSEHPVERIPVMRWQTFQRMGMFDGYGKPVEGLLI